MAVDPDRACVSGLVFTHDGTEYVSAASSLLEFRDDPRQYLDPNYKPPM